SPDPRLPPGTRTARTPRSRGPETPTARSATESSGYIPSSVSQIELSPEVPLQCAVGGVSASPLRAQLQALGLGVLGQADHDGVTVDDVTGQQRAGELVADLALDQATQRSGAEGRIVAFEGQPVLGPLSDLERDPTIGEPLGHVLDLQIDDRGEFVLVERIEEHDVIETVEELGLERRVHDAQHLLPLLLMRQ